MATIKDEILSIATEQGYEGDAPQTIAQAVNALGTVIGGGGGGGGDENVLVVKFTQSDSTIVADKTLVEILDFATAGGDVVGYIDFSGGSGNRVVGFQLAEWTYTNYQRKANFTSCMTTHISSDDGVGIDKIYVQTIYMSADYNGSGFGDETITFSDFTCRANGNSRYIHFKKVSGSNDTVTAKGWSESPWFAPFTQVTVKDICDLASTGIEVIGIMSSSSNGMTHYQRFILSDAASGGSSYSATFTNSTASSITTLESASTSASEVTYTITTRTFS